MNKSILLFAALVVSLSALGQEDRSRDNRADGLVLISSSRHHHRDRDIQRHVNRQINRHAYRGHWRDYSARAWRKEARFQVRDQIRQQMRQMRNDIRREMRHGRSYWKHS